jgi:hypothetical protein
MTGLTDIFSSPERGDGHARPTNLAGIAVAKSMCGAVIGTVRRECLDRMLAIGETYLANSFFLYGVLQ